MAALVRPLTGHHRRSAAAGELGGFGLDGGEVLVSGQGKAHEWNRPDHRVRPRGKAALAVLADDAPRTGPDRTGPAGPPELGTSAVAV